jgi:hypothetical protein
MNEPLLIALIVYAIRDGAIILLLAWLAHRLVSARTPVPVPPVIPVPVPEPSPGPVAPVPVPIGKPRFTGITATSFAGGNDSAVSRTSAYDGTIIDGDRELAAALPGPVAAGRLIRGFYKGRTADGPTRDKGPWNTRDTYWDTGARPAAEAQHANRTKAQNGLVPSNPAGIDLSPAFWKALGYVGDPRESQDKIDWDFVDVLDAKVPSPLPSPSGGIPAHLAMMRRYRDLGIHAEHDSAFILAWRDKIAAKYPEMKEYVMGYKHDSTPWCGFAMADVMTETGIRPQFGVTDLDRFLWADSWRQFGTAVETPQPGDVMVFRWAGGGHHVTLYDHETTGDYYYCTGGNQGSGHVVSTEAMPMANCVAIRRPPLQ